MTRDYGRIRQERMRGAGRPSSQPEAGSNDQPEAPVVAAVPILQASERDAIRALRNAAEVSLQLLSEASLGEDVAEYVGDFIKPHFKAVAWQCRKLLEQ